jgi:hypothetical protein
MSASSTTTRSLATAGALLFVGGALVSASAHAQALSNDWQFRATIYAYLPAVGGSSEFPVNSGNDVGFDSSKITGNLKFAFMGTLEAQKGRWGAFTDIMYLDISSSRSGTRDLTIGSGEIPAGITANTDFTIKGAVWMLGGNYRLAATPDYTFDVLGGARLLSIKESLGYSFSGDFGSFTGPGREGSGSAKEDNWDAIIGVKGRVNLGDDRRWFVPYYVDVGTGDSQVTWQGIAGLGYAFSWGEAVVTYRYLDYQFKDSSRFDSLHFSGPTVGLACRW